MKPTLLATIAAAGLAHHALACTSSPPTPPPTVWFESLGVNPVTGMAEVLVGQEITLFAPTNPTNCACGIGVGTSTVTAPTSLSAKQVFVAVVDTTTHTISPLTEFEPLLLNPATSAAIAAGPGAPTGTWFGFSGLINGFTPPTLGPNEVFKLLFVLSVDPLDLNQLLQTTIAFGGGEADGNGIPLFSGQHPFEYFRPDNDEIPSPGPFALASLALLTVANRRRR